MKVTKELLGKKLKGKITFINHHKSQGQKNKVIRNKSRIANVTKCFVPQVDQLHVGALRPVEEWGLRGLRGDHHHINTTYSLFLFLYYIWRKNTMTGLREHHHPNTTQLIFTPMSLVPFHNTCFVF